MHIPTLPPQPVRGEGRGATKQMALPQAVCLEILAHYFFCFKALSCTFVGKPGSQAGRKEGGREGSTFPSFSPSLPSFLPSFLGHT